MIIKITPPTPHIIDPIIIIPREYDDVRISECYNGFKIETDIGRYGIRMKDGGLEVKFQPRGSDELTTVLSVDDHLSICPEEIQKAQGVMYKGV